MSVESDIQEIKTNVAKTTNFVSTLTDLFLAGGVTNADWTTMKAELQADYTSKLSNVVMTVGTQEIDGTKTFLGQVAFRTKFFTYLPDIPQTDAPSTILGQSVDMQAAGFKPFASWSAYCDVDNKVTVFLGAKSRGSISYNKGLTIDALSNGDATASFNSTLNTYNIFPLKDNTYYLGSNDTRWKNIYATTGIVNTSDARVKTDINNIPEEVLEAWGKCEFKQFKFIDAITEKGNTARIHFGAIAQELEKCFKDFNIDPTRYGFFCYDKWEANYKNEIYEIKPEIRDSNNNIISNAEYTSEKVLITPAGDRYSLRYEEVLVLEAAYQRWRADKLEARISALEAKIK